MTRHLTSWPGAPLSLQLTDNEVHVWRASFEQPASTLTTFINLLSSDELDRAGRFYFQKDRDHFIIARGLLRIILGGYLHLEPSALRFRYNAFGKPALVDPSASGALCFNLSHSHELALYAFTRRREIGVDIEYMRQDFATWEIAERFFSRREVAVLRALPPALRTQGFFNCWTRKEAYIKARGEGLSLPLDQFDVSLTPGEAAALLSVADDPEEASRWSMKELLPGLGYAAAVVVEGHGWELSCRHWGVVPACIKE